jgi:hypothetical protein
VHEIWNREGKADRKNNGSSVKVSRKPKEAERVPGEMKKQMSLETR